MGLSALLLCTSCYVVVCISNCKRRDWPMAIVFGAYALSNVGFIFHFLKERS
jgi:hypothetical protein